MGLISYTTCSLIVGIYVANRAIYRFFFNPQKRVVSISVSILTLVFRKKIGNVNTI